METNLIDHTFNWAPQRLDKLIVSPQHSLNYPRLHGLRNWAQIVANSAFPILSRFGSQTPSSEPISYSQGKYTIPNWKGCTQFMMGNNICEKTKPWIWSCYQHSLDKRSIFPHHLRHNIPLTSVASPQWQSPKSGKIPISNPIFSKITSRKWK